MAATMTKILCEICNEIRATRAELLGEIVAMRTCAGMRASINTKIDDTHRRLGNVETTIHDLADQQRQLMSRLEAKVG